MAKQYSQIWSVIIKDSQARIQRTILGMFKNSGILPLNSRASNHHKLIFESLFPSFKNGLGEKGLLSEKPKSRSISLGQRNQLCKVVDDRPSWLASKKSPPLLTSYTQQFKGKGRINPYHVVFKQLSFIISKLLSESVRRVKSNSNVFRGAFS